MAKVQYTVRIEDDLFDKLKKMADLERRSVNNQFEHCIAKQIEVYESENGAAILLEKS